MAPMLARTTRGIAAAILLASLPGVASAQTPPTPLPPPATKLRADIPPLPPWPDFNAPPVYSGPTAVRLQLRSDTPDLQVEILEQTPAGWRSVCTSPCTTQVDGRDAFAVGGGGITASSTFRLSGPSTVVASPVVRGFASIVYLSLGGFFVVHGGVFFLVGSSEGQSPGNVFRTIGAVELVAAVPLLVLGVIDAVNRTSAKVVPEGTGRMRELLGGKWVF